MLKNIHVASKNRKSSKANKDSENKNADKRKTDPKSQPLVRTSIPAKCPITTCRQRLAAADALSHFMERHLENNNHFHEVGPNESVRLTFDPLALGYRDTKCVGILAYEDSHWKNTPHATNNIPLFSHFENHLPVFVFASKTTKRCESRMYKIDCVDNDTSGCFQQSFIFWLVEVQSGFLGRCYLSISDTEATISRGALIDPRPFNSQHSVDDIVDTDINFVVLRQNEMKTLTQNGTKRVIVEVNLLPIKSKIAIEEDQSIESPIFSQ